MGKLYTELEIANGTNCIKVFSPDEDDEIRIVIKDGKRKTDYCMNAKEAKDLSEFLADHVKNIKKSNG